MPKISDERRAARREQILNAAWLCFDRRGLHATTMEDIIRQADLSAGAVYLYFASKEELIQAAVSKSLTDLQLLLAPLLTRSPAPSPSELLRGLLEQLISFSKRQDFDLLRIALHGWSEAQHNKALKALMVPFYRQARELLAAALARSASGTAPASDAANQAQVLLSIIMGFVAQHGILGDADPGQHVEGLIALKELV